MPVAVKRLIAMEANDYAVYDDYAAHEVPVIENGVRVNVYVPESLLAITPQSAGAIERKLDRNSERGRKVAVHEYDDELELAL